MTAPLSAGRLGALDAFFEALSGVTTTGLSTLATIEDKSYAFLFIRAWLQWCGGLGIVVLGVALLIHPGPEARRLAMMDEEGDLAGSTRSFARRMLRVYLALTAGGIVLLWIVGGGLDEAVLYTLAAVSTGGFSPRDESLAAHGSTAFAAAVLLLCLLGAFPLVLYARLRREGWRALGADPQWKALLGAVVVTVAALGLCMTAQGTWSRSQIAHHAVLMGISAQTTAGFSVADPAAFSPASKMVMILAMLLGGSFGSTAGGIKVLRLLVLWRLLHLAIVRTRLPRHAVVTPRLGSRALEESDYHGAIVVAMLFLGAVVLSWLAFLLAGQPPLDALFEVVSATGTVGLTTGLAAPDLAPGLKLVLCADMLMGRLEVFALVVFVHPRTWLGQRAGVE
jgi:trk system potassium uptake protein TrkH